VSVDRLAHYSTFCQLLYALENARNQLAITMAAEAKRTTPEKWNSYIETGQRALRCLRRLRCGAVTREASQRWRCALEILHTPADADDGRLQGEAGRLCELLRKVVSVLEGDPTAATDCTPRSGPRAD
jgi:hypothetical protein